MSTDIPDTLDAYGNQLHAAIERDLARGPRSGRMKRRALALSVPAAAAAGHRCDRAPDRWRGRRAEPGKRCIIRHVRAELNAPHGQILHESAAVTLADGSSTAFELWTQTGTGVYRVIKFGQEVSLSATQNEIYDASRNTITVSPLPPAVHQSEVSRGGDPAAELKRMVESGQTTATATTYNGTPAYKLSVNSSSDPSLNGTAYVARSNYEPLEFDSAADPSGKVVFSAYQYLPATPANAALLSVTSAHRGATVVHQP